LTHSRRTQRNSNNYRVDLIYQSDSESGVKLDTLANAPEISNNTRNQDKNVESGSESDRRGQKDEAGVVF
jgi:hypothetical protein